jgi:hypothetical protein
MKTKLINVLPFLIFLFTACNNSEQKNDHETHNTGQSTERSAGTADALDVKSVVVTYPDLDAKLAASLKEVVDHYLHIKNALANDNGGEAARGGKTMEKALRNIDKSLFTADQKKIFDEEENGLKEHAGHIGKDGDNIKRQRSHFSMMSEVMYDLVKTFGAGQPLYHDHCPMYNDNKGGMWLSETKEIKNPYFGSEMPKCGTIEEIIR